MNPAIEAGIRPEIRSGTPLLNPLKRGTARWAFQALAVGTFLALACGPAVAREQPGSIVVAEPGAISTAQAQAQATEVTGIIAAQTATAKESTITPTPEPTAIAEAQKPTPTIPEIKKVVCGIFEDSELCGKGEIVTWTDETDNRNYTLIGFRKGVIPPKTPIINTKSGAEFIRVDAPEPFYGKRVTIVERNVPNPLNYTFYGNIAVSETHAAYRGIGLGESVGFVGNETTTTGRFKDFDLLVRITDRDPDAPGKIRTAQKEIDSKFSPIATQGTEISGALQPTVTYAYPTPTPK